MHEQYTRYGFNTEGTDCKSAPAGMMDKNMIKLLQLLEQSIQILETCSEGYSGEFISAEEFCATFKLSVSKLRNGDNTQLKKLWTWFAPTCQWDDFAGSYGIDLGDDIFNLICTVLYQMAENKKSEL